MAVNESLIRRPSDRSLFLAAAVGFPLLVLIGYFKSYYFMAFFSDARPIANALVHIHGVIMTVWVLYFVAQVALIRSKNIKLHMSMGIAGIALAVIVIVTGMVTAYDSMLVRKTTIPGIDPHSFFIYPFGDMVMFAVFFAGAIYYRKKPAEHKSLMLLSAINFLPAAFSRLPIGIPSSPLFVPARLSEAIAVTCFIWYTAKHRKLIRVFAGGVIFLIAGHLIEANLAETEIWLRAVDLIAP